jgi:hypothetical protein
MRDRPKLTADQWNAKCPPGTPVRFEPVRGRPETEDTRTRSEAWTLGHGQAVVLVEGRSGCVAIDHLVVSSERDLEDEQPEQPDELFFLRDEWTKAGKALFEGPSIPSRNEVIDAAKRVVLAAMKRAGLSITAAAKRCGSSRRAIRDNQKRAGIYEAPRATVGRQDIDWDAEPDLGKVPDYVLAERHRCGLATVASARHTRNIPGFRRGRADAPLAEPRASEEVHHG